MLNSIHVSPVDRLNLKNIYCCVLVKGTNDQGAPLYAYFGVFLEKIEEMLRVIQAGRPEVDPDFWTTGRPCLDGRRGRSQRAIWKASQGVRLPRP